MVPSCRPCGQISSSAGLPCSTNDTPGDSRSCGAPGFAAYYDFLAALGGRAALPAGLLLQRALLRLAPEGPLLFALDDSPTQRYGRHVQSAGLHHNTTPGPTEQRFLYGHVWVTLSWVVAPPLWGTIGLPIRALLYVRKKDVPRLQPR